MIDRLMLKAEGTRLVWMALLVRGRKGEDE